MDPRANWPGCLRFLLDGGPGTYTVTVDRAAVYFDSFVLARWGLDGPYDLEAGRRSSSVLQSPFEWPGPVPGTGTL